MKHCGSIYLDWKAQDHDIVKLRLPVLGTKDEMFEESAPEESDSEEITPETEESNATWPVQGGRFAWSLANWYRSKDQSKTTLKYIAWAQRIWSCIRACPNGTF